MMKNFPTTAIFLKISIFKLNSNLMTSYVSSGSLNSNTRYTVRKTPQDISDNGQLCFWWIRNHNHGKATGFSTLIKRLIESCRLSSSILVEN